jgi:hypothetical protein
MTTWPSARRPQPAPAQPADPTGQLGAGEDANGVGVVVFATGDGVVVDLGGPGAGEAGVADQVADVSDSACGQPGQPRAALVPARHDGGRHAARRTVD